MKKILLAAALGFTFASPAVACEFGKHDGASAKSKPNQASAAKKEKHAKVKTDKGQAAAKDSNKKI